MLTQPYIIHYLVLFLLWSQCPLTSQLHLQGVWSPSEDFFLFLSKFGFQKSLIKNREETRGYVFGNITSLGNNDIKHPIRLTFLDRNYFLDYYKNRNIDDKNEACESMFSKIDKIAFESHCNDKGQEDFLRRIPCPRGMLCADEDNPSNVRQGYQFTYIVENMETPRFWYLSMVACDQDSATCKWKSVNESILLNYDVWLVNGDPNLSQKNPFEYQFSFDKRDTVEVYLIFCILYLILTPLEISAAMYQDHPITRLLTFSLCLELFANICNLIHVLKFAYDGIGVEVMSIVGDMLDILARTLLMLLLLLLAKGWAVTRIELSWKPLVFCVWGLYAFANILLYVWNLTEVDVIEDIDVYQTWPGLITLIFRTLMILWFLWELRNTMMYEHNDAKLAFFLHFGASALVWFIYLPIVAIIAAHVSALWRSKLLLGITASADFLAFAILTHLLWPTRSQQYFLLSLETDHGEELEEFNEAPHALNHHRNTNGRSPQVIVDDPFIKHSDTSSLIASS